MSLFPSERFSISVGSSGVGVVAYRGRWHPVRRDAFELNFDAKDIDQTLIGVAQAIQTWTTPNAAVKFVVSNCFVRASLLPWAGGDLNAQEATILAQQHFLTLYGDMGDWEIRSDLNCDYGEAMLAFAMPVQLINGLNALCSHHQIDCRGIEPAAAASWNHHINSLGAQALFGAFDGGYGFLLASELHDKRRRPLSARMLTLDAHADTDALQSLMQREIMLQGLSADINIACEVYGFKQQAGNPSDLSASASMVRMAEMGAKP